MQIRDITAGLTAIKAIAKKWRIKHNIKCLMIDYLQLMDAKGDTREQAVSSISRGLKLLAKELKIPIVVLSQLNRECEKRPNKIPQLSDLRESGLDAPMSSICLLTAMQPKARETALLTSTVV